MPKDTNHMIINVFPLEEGSNVFNDIVENTKKIKKMIPKINGIK